jgi:NADPH:quinone reductase-like Zn-dependent oxidoreductase
MPTTRRDLMISGTAVATALAATAAEADAAARQGTPVTQRAWQIGSQQGIDSLQLASHPAQAPGPGEVAIAVRASALNHRDLNIVAARYGPAKPANRVPASDGSGDVVGVGPGVTSWRVGDRVTAPHFIDWIDGQYSPAVFARDLGNTADGWLAERIVLPAASLVRVPETLSHAEAAALGAAGITAWAVLEAFARVQPGDIVLALGTGGVAVLALQIAKMAGATVAITSSSETKLQAVRALGADITVNYRSRPDWQVAIREATGGRGVDIVVETGGFATLPQSLACCAPNARIGLLGALAGRAEGGGDLSPMIGANAIVKGITSGSRRMLEDLLRACAANGLQPKIDRQFAFGEASEAFRYLQTGAHVGKIVLRHD